MILLTTRQVRALREDALSDIGNIAVRRLPEDQRIIYGPHRCRLRIGDQATPLGPRTPRVVYRKRPPTCRACNRRIEHGAKVIAFKIRSKGDWNDLTAFIHQECPEVGSGS